MPRIERNKYYAVCCLMHNSGKITVAYDVADWEDGGDYQLEFDYPSYELLQPFGGGTAPTRSRRFTTMAAHHRQQEPTLLGSPSQVL